MSSPGGTNRLPTLVLNHQLITQGGGRKCPGWIQEPLRIGAHLLVMCKQHSALPSLGLEPTTLFAVNYPQDVR